MALCKLRVSGASSTFCAVGEATALTPQAVTAAQQSGPWNSWAKTGLFNRMQNGRFSSPAACHCIAVTVLRAAIQCPGKCFLMCLSLLIRSDFGNLRPLWKRPKFLLRRRFLMRKHCPISENKPWGTSAPSLAMQQRVRLRGGDAAPRACTGTKRPAHERAPQALRRSGLAPCTLCCGSSALGASAPASQIHPLPTRRRPICEPYLSLEVDCIFQSLDPRPQKLEQDKNKRERERKEEHTVVTSAIY